MKNDQPTLPVPAAPESLEGLLRRDLDAWIAAKAAIKRARGG